MTANHRTREQQRAGHAYKSVQQAAGLAGDARSGKKTVSVEYRDELKRLAQRIRSSGLGQAVAFQMGKNKSKQLTRDLSSWLTDCGFFTLEQQMSPEDTLLDWIMGDRLEHIQLRLATREALSWLDWAGRFAEVFIQKRSDGGNSDKRSAR